MSAAETSDTSAAAPDGDTAQSEVFYDLDEAAKRLQLQRAEVYRRVVDGALKSEKRDRHLFFAAAELERYQRTVADEGQQLRSALQEATAHFTERLTARGQLGELPTIDAANTDALVAELGRLILRDALLDSIPDLYFDPLHDGMRLLAGQEGNRRERARFPAVLANKLVEWVISLAPIPNEGGIGQALGQHACNGVSYQLRLAAVPTLLGQLIHLHFFLDVENRGLEGLGYLPAQANALKPILSGRPGLVILAGSPGPNAERQQLGLAQHLADEGRLVVCLQRPVQYRDDSLVQLDMGSEGDFSALWRTALDMRPNAILVEDVLDPTQVRSLIQGAGAGALVIAFVSASGIRDALLRLLSSEVIAADLARVLLGAVEFTSMRQLCQHCRQASPTAGEAEALFGEGAVLAEPRGCSHCGDGYLGYRTAHAVWSGDALRPWIAGTREDPVPAANADLSRSASVHRAVLDMDVHWAEARTHITS